MYLEKHGRTCNRRQEILYPSLRVKFTQGKAHVMRNEMSYLNNKRGKLAKDRRKVSPCKERGSCIYFQTRRTHNQYDVSFRNNPGEPGVGSLNPILDGRDGSGSPGTHACRTAHSHPGARPICS